MNVQARFCRLIILLSLSCIAGGCATRSPQDTTIIVPSPNLDSPKATLGVTMDESDLRKMAAVNPAAALMLAGFLPDHWTPIRNLLGGEAGLMARATPATLEALLSNSSPDAQMATMEPFEESVGQMVRWRSTQLPDGALEVRFSTVEGTWPDGLLVPAYPDITVIVDRNNASLTSFAIGNQRAHYSPLPPTEASSVLNTYLTRWVNADYAGAAAVTHALVHEKFDDVPAMLKSIESELPTWFELGEARRYLGDRRELVLVPARRVTKGYPANVRYPQIFAIARDDANSDWGVIDSGCLSITGIQKLFPDFDGLEFERVSQAPFVAKTIVSLQAAEERLSR